MWKKNPIYIQQATQNMFQRWYFIFLCTLNIKTCFFSEVIEIEPTYGG